MASASKCMVHCTLGTIYLPTTLIVNGVALSKQSIKLKNFKKKSHFAMMDDQQGKTQIHVLMIFNLDLQ
jgi:hypothetical protein